MPSQLEIQNSQLDLPRDRPFVFVNMAMSADGKIATANRAITGVGSPRDLAHLYELRATADAVMSGARTIEESRATLGPGGDKYRRARLRRGLREHALRIAVSGSGSISPSAEIFRHRFAPIILLATKRAGKARLAPLRQHADEIFITGSRELDWGRALRWLREKHDVRRLLCEGGGELNDALFRAGVVDELHLTICPKLIGGRAAPTIADGQGIARLARASHFKLARARRIGPEFFLVYRRA